jgi:hypothetical protein
MELLREILRFFSEKNVFYDKLFRRLGLDSVQLLGGPNQASCSFGAFTWRFLQEALGKL